MLILTIPEPNQSFLIRISVSESIIRSDKKKEPFSEDEKQREKRYELYENLKNDCKWNVIMDGMQSESIITELILKSYNENS